ncbi:MULTISPECIES: hypothetical protein [Niastella]|uniref:Uncharacterized protein n=1 Tax=Niastella soli TaxID=2821487 RepID=A0ABS3YW95_9BACT|nr:hypothetical protein [Niastella soli]MBO9202204.1 hypothetical protein [Niastella soli]
MSAATGIITTVAGGALNSTGDGGPATSAQLAYTNNVAADETSNGYNFNRGRLSEYRECRATILFTASKYLQLTATAYWFANRTLFCSYFYKQNKVCS